MSIVKIIDPNMMAPIAKNCLVVSEYPGALIAYTIIKVIKTKFANV